jgi:C_GCAxxG_C_C family probable redox protein
MCELVSVEQVIAKTVNVARAYFLTEENIYGCAETTFMALKTAYGLPDPGDSGAAMALNGGVAYGGNICGAISGAAMAVGMLAKERIQDHKSAKRAARQIIMSYMDEFRQAYQSVNCIDLIELDIRDEEEHRRFIESGIWRTACMDQIEFAVRKLAPLNDQIVWERAVQEAGCREG